MSLTASSVQAWIRDLIAKGETDLTKAEAMFGEIFPILEAACAAVGGPVADEVVAILNATTNVVKIAQTVAQPVAAAAAADPSTITATEAANIAVAASAAVASIKSTIASTTDAIKEDRH